VIEAVREDSSGRWFPAAAAMAMTVVLSLGFAVHLEPEAHGAPRRPHRHRDTAF